MKSKLKRALALVLSAVMLTFAAPVLNEHAGITAAAAEQKWDNFYDRNRCSTVSIDKNNYHGKSGYSIKITNKNYNQATVSKKFAVKKNTQYRISVWVKTTGLKNDPEKKGKDLGAYIYFNTPKTPYYQWYNGKTWKKLEFIINSDSLTELEISLWNGIFDNYCKGTAWFSDFKIEEFVGQKTNKWNVLAVVFKNVKAPVVLDGKKQIYKDTLNNADVKRMTDILNGLYTSVPLLSENKWGFKCIDVVSSNAVINELETYGEGYCLDKNSKCVSKELDRLIEKAEKESGKRYNQIIAIAPLSGVAKVWFGLGGGTYNGINFCQVQLESGDDWKYLDPISYDRDYKESVFVHEMLHCVERISKEINPDRTIALHSNVDTDFGLKYYTEHNCKGWGGWGAWHADYIRAKTPVGKGVVSEAFKVYNTGKWKVIYGNKTVTKPTKTDISTLKISKPGNYYYSGKAKCPAITVKNGTKRLVKGKDYKLTYYNNKEIGLATVVVEGIGKYTGKYAQNFKISPNKTTLKATKSASGYKLSWSPVKYAEKYDVAVSYVDKNGKKITKTYTYNSTTTSATLKIKSSSACTFKVLAYKSIYPQKFGVYSNIVKI